MRIEGDEDFGRRLYQRVVYLCDSVAGEYRHTSRTARAIDVRTGDDFMKYQCIELRDTILNEYAEGVECTRERCCRESNWRAARGAYRAILERGNARFERSHTHVLCIELRRKLLYRLYNRCNEPVIIYCFSAVRSKLGWICRLNQIREHILNLLSNETELSSGTERRIFPIKRYRIESIDGGEPACIAKRNDILFHSLIGWRASKKSVRI